MSADNNGLLLLKAIKNITYHHQSQKYTLHNVFDAKKRFFAQHQGSRMATNKFFTQFMNNVEDVEHNGRNVWRDTGVNDMILMDMTKAEMSARQLKMMKTDVRERLVATAFKLYEDSASGR
jgi:hypothetical protein